MSNKAESLIQFAEQLIQLTSEIHVANQLEEIRQLKAENTRLKAEIEQLKIKNKRLGNLLNKATYLRKGWKKGKEVKE